MPHLSRKLKRASRAHHAGQREGKEGGGRLLLHWSAFMERKKKGVHPPLTEWQGKRNRGFVSTSLASARLSREVRGERPPHEREEGRLFFV